MLGSENLVEIGSTIVSRLTECGYNGNATLSLYVDKEMLKKIDEDVYYRLHASEEEFKPSEQVILKFGKFNIIIKTEGEST